MDWIQVLTIIFAMAGICWGMFSRLDTKLDTKIDGLSREIHQWNMNFQERVTRLEVKKELEEKK